MAIAQQRFAQVKNSLVMRFADGKSDITLIIWDFGGQDVRNAQQELVVIFITAKAVPVVTFCLFATVISFFKLAAVSMHTQQYLRLADSVCCNFFVVVVPQVFHAMHSLLTHPLGIYAVVFDIRKLLNPDTREQVGSVALSDRQRHIAVVIAVVWSDVGGRSIVAFSIPERCIYEKVQ